MPRNKKLTPEQLHQLRVAFHQACDQGVPLAEAVRTMRRISGLDQTGFARLLGIAPRALMEIERGRGNPTLKTLEKLGRPFGLTVGFVREHREEESG